jgi:hypothetical protein
VVFGGGQSKVSDVQRVLDLDLGLAESLQQSQAVRVQGDRVAAAIHETEMCSASAVALFVGGHHHVDGVDDEEIRSGQAIDLGDAAVDRAGGHATGHVVLQARGLAQQAKLILERSGQPELGEQVKAVLEAQLAAVLSGKASGPRVPTAEDLLRTADEVEKELRDDPWPYAKCFDR